VLFRIVAVMLFEPPVSRSRAAGGLPALLAGAACAAVVVTIGFLPSRTIAELNSIIPQRPNAGGDGSSSAGSSRSVQRKSSHGRQTVGIYTSQPHF
jgi:hypothetical protein